MPSLLQMPVITGMHSTLSSKSRGATGKTAPSFIISIEGSNGDRGE